MESLYPNDDKKFVTCVSPSPLSIIPKTIDVSKSMISCLTDFFILTKIIFTVQAIHSCHQAQNFSCHLKFLFAEKGYFQEVFCLKFNGSVDKAETYNNGISFREENLN